MVEVDIEQNFDAWGRHRNPNDWTYDNIPETIDRGFTGHEHMPEFALINMNARLYDPIVGKMISPDNYVIAPFSSQAYNRYTYANNNPLLYSDPTGNFAILDSWLVGFVHGFFSSSSNRFGNAWNEANRRAAHDAKIWGGLFASDPNKSFFGRFGEIASRFSWQIFQTIGGFMTAHSVNTLGLYGGVSNVDYAYGATAVTTRSGSWGAVAQGSFIVGNNTLKADANNPLFQHEYGHYLQSQKMGLAYYPRVGIPSARSNPNNHDSHPVEQDANRRAFLYFNKNIYGFQDDTELTNVNHKDNKGWDFRRNGFVDQVGQQVYQNGDYMNYVDYQNANHLNSLNIIKVQAKWYDYTSWAFLPLGAPIWIGFLNAYQYNR